MKIKHSHMHRRSVCLLLALLCAQTASCSSQTPDIGESTAADTTTEKADSLAPGFERSDYGGEEFHVLTPEWSMYTSYFFADEATGEVLNDALYERTLLTEEYLNIDITHEHTGNYKTYKDSVDQAVLAGDDAYQLVLTHCIGGLGDMVTTGMLCDWNDIGYVDFDKPYWKKACNEELEVNGKQYFASSDFMLDDYNCILFNKDMIGSFKLENPYDLVRSGKWTLDKLTEMSAVVTRDLNGDGKWTIEDQYGFSSEDQWTWNSFIHAAGISLVTTDENGSMALDLDTNRMVTLVEKLDSFINGTNDCFNYSIGAKSESERLRIDSGRVLFSLEIQNELYLFRDADVDYGILPFPKLDEAQENYVTLEWQGLMCVPITVKNTDMVGKACELLAYYSGDTVIPAYIDVTLGEKIARDEDSKEMLDLIYDTMYFDPGLNYFGFATNMQQLFYTIPYLIIQGDSSNYMSWLESYKSGAVEEINSFLDAMTQP